MEAQAREQVRKLLFRTKKDIQKAKDLETIAYLYAMTEGFLQGLVLAHTIDRQEYKRCRMEMESFRKGTETMKKAPSNGNC